MDSRWSHLSPERVQWALSQVAMAAPISSGLSSGTKWAPDGHLGLVRPGPAELALRADQDRAGVGVDEELGDVARAQAVGVGRHDLDDVGRRPSPGCMRVCSASEYLLGAVDVCFLCAAAAPASVRARGVVTARGVGDAKCSPQLRKTELGRKDTSYSFNLRAFTSCKFNGCVQQISR